MFIQEHLAVLHLAYSLEGNLVCLPKMRSVWSRLYLVRDGVDRGRLGREGVNDHSTK